MTAVANVLAVDAGIGSCHGGMGHISTALVGSAFLLIWISGVGDVRHRTSICSFVVGVALMTLLTVVMGTFVGGAVHVAAWEVRHSTSICK